MSERIIRDFTTIIELIARGGLLERLDEEIGDLIDQLEAVNDEKAKGSITLTLDFQRLADRTDIKGTVKVKPPAAKAVPAMTLFNIEGGLSVQHPGQTDMFSGPRGVAAERKAV